VDHSDHCGPRPASQVHPRMLGYRKGSPDRSKYPPQNSLTDAITMRLQDLDSKEKTRKRGVDGRTAVAPKKALGPKRSG